MGKKLSQAASKNNEKKDFNNWIKVLKPKVYITDCSSFKQLVQELTGNGTSTSTSTSSLSPITTTTTKTRLTEKVPVIEIDEDREGESENSVEASIGATPDSSEFCHQVFLDQEFDRVCNEIFLEDVNLGNFEANQQVDLLAYWDLESWLLDSSTDSPYGVYNGSCQMEQDVSIYDYELSGFL